MHQMSSRAAGGAALLLLLLLLLHCCHIASTRGHKSDSALAVMENTGGGDEEEEVTVEEDEGDLEVVQPTEEWQTLQPGQAVPAGSHVRLNLQTGQREVRLGEEQLKYWTQEHRETEESRPSFSPTELKRAMKKIKEDMNPASKDQQQMFRPLEELKKDMAQLDLLVETDVQIMRRLLESFNSSESTTEQRLSVLMELEYLVHQVLFAVASLLRNFPYAQRHFLTHGGLQVLSELFRADGGGVLRTRIVTMLYDMISEKELISQAGLDLGLDATHEERLRQYSAVSLQGELREKGWCSLVPQLLESTEHDYREKALRALLAMAPVCLDQYRSDGSLLGSLLSLREQYLEMVQSEMIVGEENGYFGEIVELINALQVKIKR